eukprot:TRINITY_DN7074_c0_g1_i1.p1 TRINITY_DN7074_c0_g1~~TRINITY_DN7074_c0_g1_i1.p1  ORF type:complete len:613 (-),score=123.01 TRINITY_DN7074_c0_g1_i1:259-2097(-)
MNPDPGAREADTTLYCICKQRDDNTFMVYCDSCHDWFHGRCVNIQESQGKYILKYVCPLCEEKGLGHTTYKGFGKNKQQNSTVVKQNEAKRIQDQQKRLELKRQQLMKSEDIKRAQMEERKRQLQLKKTQMTKQKFNQDPIKKKRFRIAARLAKALDRGHGEQDVINDDHPSNEELGKSIEIALHNEYDASSTDSKEYLKHYRTLDFNIGDKKNHLLRNRIRNGDISFSKLVKMSTEQLANQEEKKYRKARTSLAIQNMQKVEKEEVFIKKTEQGLEFVRKETEPAQPLEDIPKVKRRTPSPEPEERIKTKINRKRKRERGDILESPKRKKSDAVQEQEDPIPVPQSQEIDYMDLEFDFDDFNLTPTKNPTKKILSTDFKLKGDPFSDEEPEETKTITNSIVAEKWSSTVSLITNWSGNILYTIDNYDITLKLRSYHLDGPKVENYVPSILNVDKRMNLTQLKKYLVQIENSSSRIRTVCNFETISPVYDSQYTSLIHHLLQIDRGGVFVDYELKENVHKKFFKELYILPVRANENLPFLRDQDSLLNNSKDHLIGVYLTSKDPEHIPKTGEPAPYIPAGRNKVKHVDHTKSSNIYVPTSQMPQAGKFNSRF